LAVSATAAESDSALRSACDAESLELPPLPRIAAEVARLAAMATSDSADTAITSDRELATLIQNDVALAGQVMRVANSALYARSSPLSSLRQAIAWLGMIEIRKLAYGFALKSSLFAATTFRDELTRLWGESLCTALFAQEIARVKRRNVESAYLCGLMHRAGLAVILWRLGRHEHSPTSPAGADLDAFAAGLEASVGVRLANAWGLPRAATACIRHWRTPLAAHDDRIDVAQVALARAMAIGSAHGEPQALANELVQRGQPLLTAIDLYAEDLSALLERRAIITAAASAFT
jgi:HD-like signal output (HDOD) protein